MLILLAACTPADDTTTALPTPEEVAATAAPGDRVQTSGTVFAVTFDTVTAEGSDNPDDDDTVGYERLPGRYFLVRSARAAGVTTDELIAGGLTSAEVEAASSPAWSLGVALAEGEDAPQTGSVVYVAGTFQQASWNGGTRPVVEDATVEIVSGWQPAGDGEACAIDADCGDRSYCEPTARTCTPLPPDESWGSEWRGVVGACAADSECPTGQWCDPGYTISDTGDYAPNYYVDRDAGKHLCVPVSGLGESDLCPRPSSAMEIAGGRWAEGKEVCVEGVVALSVPARDGDTHEQLAVDEPLVFPLADAPYYLFGATAENVPPYKDPSRPQGALLDPATGARTAVLGTFHYDSGHGWFEIHPVKAYWPRE